MEKALKTSPAPRAADWQATKKPVPYPEAVATMEERARQIREESASDLIWLLEHPPLYTAGTSANVKDLLKSEFPVFQTGRGGQYTYHGPGQRIVYCMMDLQKRGADLRRYICDLEEWIILSLRQLGVTGERRPGRVGIWVVTKNGEEKIAAVGVRVRKWVTYHGISINVNPDLSHYSGIVPCGLGNYGVTSLKALGCKASMADLDDALRKTWSAVFG